MKNGKYTRRSSGMKVTSVLLAALLLVGCSIGATLAWMTAQSSEVENTFTVGNIQIELWEHDYDPASNSLITTGEDGGLVKSNADYPLTPGKNMPKDPFVTVKAGSEKCWLFVAVKEEDNPDLGDRGHHAVQYDVNEASGGGEWNALKGDSPLFKSEYKVYYRVQEAVTEDTPVYILKQYASCEDEGHANGCVKVNPNVTSSVTDAPTLTFTAAAIQYDGLEMVDGDDVDVDYTLNAAIEAFKNLPDEFKNAVLQSTEPADPEI